GLVAGRQHAVARHHDRTRVAAERLADVARQLDAAEFFRDVAIGHGLARRDFSRDVVDAAVEFRHAVEIEVDLEQVLRFPRGQLGHRADRVLHPGRRLAFRDVAVALVNTPAGLLFAAHRQLHAGNAALAPDHAAGADRGVENRKMLAGHGWLLPGFLLG